MQAIKEKKLFDWDSKYECLLCNFIYLRGYTSHRKYNLQAKVIQHLPTGRQCWSRAVFFQVVGNIYIAK